MNDDQSTDQFPSDRLSDAQLDAIVGGAGTNSVTYPCDICGQSFRTLDALDRHTKQEHA